MNSNRKKIKYLLRLPLQLILSMIPGKGLGVSRDLFSDRAMLKIKEMKPLLDF